MGKIHCIIYVAVFVLRAYHGSELVVTNTLAKWKKLEPNGIDFSQNYLEVVLNLTTLCPLAATFVVC